MSEMYARPMKTLSLPCLRLWIGNTASGLATWALPFVLGLVAMEGTMSSTELGLSLAVRTVGFLIAVPLAGIWSDRHGPRRIVLVSGLVGAVSIPIIFSGLSGFGPAASILLLVGAVVVSLGQGACRPAYQAMIPEIVTVDHLQAANAAMSISVRVTSLVGPAAVSVITLAFGTGAAFTTIAALWLVSAVVPPRGRVSSRASASRRNILSEYLVAVDEAKRHPWFVAGLATLTIVIATGYSVTAVLVPVISQQVSGGAMLMTETATAFMIGALFGAVLATRWQPVNRGWTALAGLSLYGLVPLSLLAADWTIFPVLAFFLAGVGIEIFNVPWFTSVQTEIPQDRLARVSSLDFLFSYGLAPAGLALMTPLADTFGRDPVLVLSGIICLTVPGVAMLIPTSRHFSVTK